MTHRAFVSSTFVDLKDHRAHVIGSLQKAGFAVDPMENWTADSDEPKNFSQDRLNGCDLCILLVAFRRGYVPDGETLSITQLEYEAAVKQGIDILPFMLDDEAPWRAKFDEREKDPEILKWRKDLEKRHGVERFGLEPRSIDMTGALSRWLAKKQTGQTEKSDVSRVNWPDGRSPYPGLLSFDQEYAELFFGRDREVAEVIAKMWEPGGRFLIVSGASGSGKSSVVGAGIWRALICEDRIPGSKAWEWLRIQPGDGTTPFLALAWGLKQSFPKVASRPQALANELMAKTTTVAKLLASQLSQGQELVLFIDQLEELYTQAFEDKDIRSFLEELIATTRDNNSRLRVVATVRSEFISRLEESEPVLRLLNEGDNYHLGPVSPRALQDMIERPAQVTGYDFEAGLVNDILNEAAQEPGTLPLVAYALKQLFERRRERTFTRDCYKEIKGVAGAIGTQADQEIANLDHHAQSAFDRVFAELVHIERDRPPTKKRASLAMFKGNEGANELINALAGPDCRILVTGGDASDPAIQVAHEKLFSAWPRLQEWIDKGGEALRLIDYACEAARRWRDGGDIPGELWLGARAAEVVDALQLFGKQASPILERFVRPQQILLEQLKQDSLSHDRRALIGRILAEYGDLREGVGLRPDGLPDIQWIEIEPGKVKLVGVEQMLEAAEQVFEVKHFRIAKYPVTNVQFDAFVKDGGYRSNEWWEGIKQTDGPAEPSWKEANSPRVNVSWFEAVAFCRWLTVKCRERGLLDNTQDIRLPNEWEWQQAAAGGDPKRAFPWQGKWDPMKCNGTDSLLNRTSAVGIYLGGATDHGLLDMAGNVCEWCLNKYEKPGTPESMRIDDHENLDRALRGGSWLDSMGSMCCSNRNWSFARTRADFIGFRLAQDLE
jgi:formylglycine-generating enzyme required for sulfatase activity